MIALLLVSGALAQPPSCGFMVDGAPAQRLDCRSGGAWRVTCPLPTGRSGKIRIHLEMPDRGLEAEARVPRSAREEIELALMGPGGRAGGFIVERAAGGLLPGQAIGPMQLCPVVQPGVEPGSPPQELPVAVVVTEHEQTGFAEQEMDGGLVNRVPVYDAGTEIASGRISVVQLPVISVPVLAGAVPMLRDEPLDGSLSIRTPDDAWHAVAWSGSLRDAPVDTGDLVIATYDFAASRVEVALGPGEASSLIEADLSAWLSGDLSAPLGLVAWARSELKKPKASPFDDLVERGRPWRRADLGRAEVRVLRAGDRVRVVIAHRAAPLDDLAREAIRNASEFGL